MTKELDNMKMWESVIKCYRNYHPVYKGCKDIFDKALIDQGFAFNGEHIVPIENNSDQIGDYDHSKVFEALHANKEALQCKQKPTDKVEPKLKVGDWITNGACIIKITSIDDRYYWHDNDCVGGDIESIDKEYHLWTTQDAKDGDVLADKYKNIGIFQKCEGICWHSYIYLGCDGELRGFSIGGSHEQIDTHPATKEQCDLLFQKMKEAGYEWDAEKKEFNKI